MLDCKHERHLGELRHRMPEVDYVSQKAEAYELEAGSVCLSVNLPSTFAFLACVRVASWKAQKRNWERKVELARRSVVTAARLERCSNMACPFVIIARRKGARLKHPNQF